METSQQQRRPESRSLVTALTDCDLDFDALDILDMLWLAQWMDPEGVVRSDAPITPPIEPIKSFPPTPIVDLPDQVETDDAIDLFTNDSPIAPTPAAPTIEETPKPPQPKGMPFTVPAASALRTGIDLARSLRPLMRKVPSDRYFDLDEDATVTRIAQTQVWMPVVQSRPERWLDLDLVVEDSKTTAIWERAIEELCHLVEYQGAFRTVRTWRMTETAGQVQLFSRWRSGVGNSPLDAALVQRPHTTRELIDPTGRRLIWVVTDCTSALWQKEILYETLGAWGQSQPIAVVQMFPESLWSRTALRDGHVVKLSAFMPGIPSGRLEVTGLPRRLERRGGVDLVTVPIVTLDADSLKAWARVSTGLGDARTPGRVFDRSFIRKQEDYAPIDRTSSSQSDRSAEERVALFRSTASKPAQQLANLMAATPVSLPVIDLLRDAFRSDFAVEVQQSHVAEVLLSGLLRRCDGEGDAVCRYEFFGDEVRESGDRVRDILLGDASIKKTVQVLDVLSASICQKLNSPIKSFQALLADMESLEGDLREAMLPFAKVGVDVLRRLGGEYAAIARRYEGEAIDFPELQDCEYESISIVVLEQFEFETATIKGKGSWTIDVLEQFEFEMATIKGKGSWTIDRITASAWGYTEILHRAAPQPPILGEQENPKPPELGVGGGSPETLEMIAIPSGTFTMGAPKKESESRDSERPTHEVTVQSFYMGRHQVTQAQWKVVAGYPQIDRPLNPDPSNFKGDRLPVEKVDWDDAQEFCNRLSAHTGKTYRLPSEAEWEYACRAGTTTAFHFGETIAPKLANYRGISTYNDGPKGEYREKTIEVGSFPANAWGLHDMHGNVLEWCEDDWHSNYDRAPTDGSAWVESDRKSTYRLLRGGSWGSNLVNCRSAFRRFSTGGGRGKAVGFRVSCGFGVSSSR